MKVFIKQKKRRKEEFQFFMHDFIDACEKAGFESKQDLFPSYRFHIRALLGNVLLTFYSFIHKKCQCLIHRNNQLIVAANGVNIRDNLFPYYCGYEIVPMLWDCWPSTWKQMYSDFELFDIKKVLVTSRQVADMINEETNVRATWIPEGINQSLYHKGSRLEMRTIEVMEMGRRKESFHKVLLSLKSQGMINRIITSNLNKNGTLDDKHVAYSNSMLRSLMADSKLMICFPQCDTNPQRAGNIETLTQRYWEGMLSRCLLIGRAPKELIDLIGYNPVIEVGKGNIENQLKNILMNISKYQSIVDKNFETAQKYADWSHRINMIVKVLKS